MDESKLTKLSAPLIGTVKSTGPAADTDEDAAVMKAAKKKAEKKGKVLAVPPAPAVEEENQEDQTVSMPGSINEVRRGLPECTGRQFGGERCDGGKGQGGKTCQHPWIY